MLRYIQRAVRLFFRLFIVRSAKVMFLPGHAPKGEPAPAPPVLRQLQYRPLIAVPILIIAGLLLPTVLAVVGIDPTKSVADYGFAFVLGLCAVAALFVTWSGKRVSSMTHEAILNNYCLCLTCGYCLTGLPEKHHCPECGTGYDIEDIKRTWSEYIADQAARQLPW
jgi:hypothetical protein